MTARPNGRLRPHPAVTPDDGLFNGASCVWSSVFDGLSPSQSAAVQQAVRVREHSRGTTLFNVGDPPNDVLIVLAGRIKVYMLSADGMTFTPALYGPDRVTGLISTLRGVPRMMKAMTIDDAAIGSLTRGDLHHLMMELPLFGENIAKLVAAMASDLIWVINERALLPAKERLLHTLMSLGEPSTTSDGDVLIVRGLSQEDLAGIVGVSRTWVNLTLADMEREGFIARSRMEIHILRPTQVRSTLRG